MNSKAESTLRGNCELDILQSRKSNMKESNRQTCRKTNFLNAHCEHF